MGAYIGNMGKIVLIITDNTNIQMHTNLGSHTHKQPLSFSDKKLIILVI